MLEYILLCEFGIFTKFFNSFTVWHLVTLSVTEVTGNGYFEIGETLFATNFDIFGLK